MAEEHSKKPIGKTARTVLGRSRFEKISAVEGVFTPHATAREFRAYDAQGLSGEKRRSLIQKKFTKR